VTAQKEKKSVAQDIQPFSVDVCTRDGTVVRGLVFEKAPAKKSDLSAKAQHPLLCLPGELRNMAEYHDLAQLLLAHINLPAARARANEVLTNLVQANFMTEGQVISARRKPASVGIRKKQDSPDYFLDYAFEEVKRLSVGLPTATLIAKTTVDPSLQKAAEESVQFHLRQYGKDYGVEQSAMSVIEYGGAIRAIVGGRDYGESQYNRATSARRQPGSTFKPFVYSHAMGHGYDPKSIVDGGSITISGWTPQNYGGARYGKVSLTTALVKSINTVPVRLAHELGRRKIVELTKRMGVTSPITAEPAMPLGTSGVTTMDMATGYGVFMSGGFKTNRHSITLLTDTAGNKLYEIDLSSKKPERILSEEATRAMNVMLSQVPEWGTGRRAKLSGIKTAGKTGTTQAYRDAWFVGYTGNYVAAVWFGNDDFKSTKRLTGGRLPAMTWRRFMTYAHRGIKIRPLPYLGAAGLSDKATSDDPSKDDAIPNASLIRQKPLPAETAELLRKLQQNLRDAPPLSNAKIASGILESSKKNVGQN